MRPLKMSAALVLYALVGVSPAARGQDEPLWRFTPREKIHFRTISPLGTLLVSTDSALLALDLNTGDTLWTRSDAQGVPGRNLWFIPGTQYAVLATHTMWQVIDLQTGATRWNRRLVPFQRLLGETYLIDRGLLLAYGTVREGAPVGLAALTPDSGMLKWTLDSLVDTLAIPPASDTAAWFTIGGVQDALFDSDTTAVLVPHPGGLVRIDTRTGHLLWTQDTIRNDPPWREYGYARIATDSGLLYVPFERGIIAVRAADGSIAWRGQRKYKGVVHQMAMLPEGLLLGIAPRGGGTDTKWYLDLLDPRTGVSRWKGTLGGYSNGTEFTVRDGVVHFAAGRRWMEVDLAGDSVRHEIDYELGGGEAFSRVETTDSGFKLISPQNLIAVDTAGDVLFHTYHPAPGSSLLKKIALGALVVAAIGASVAMARSGGPQPVFIPGGARRSPLYDARARAAQLAERYLYMYTGESPDTSEHKGFWLIKIDQSNGSTVGWLRFKDRNPSYYLDPVTDIVLVPLKAEGTAGPGFEARRLHLKAPKSPPY